ncbi:MAG: hypothetical protein AB1704_19955 [Pseudomonadota bacterium]
MWPYTSYFEPIGKMGELTWRRRDDPETGVRFGPLPGDYVLREAPTVNHDDLLEFLTVLEAQDLCSPVSEVAMVADAVTVPSLTGTDAVLQIGRFLYAQVFGNLAPPAKSSLSREIEAILGIRRRFQPFYATIGLDTATSRWLARQYFFAQLHEFVENRAGIKKRLADARNRILQYIGRPVAETGSSAAIAKRINPLGAPPQIA